MVRPAGWRRPGNPVWKVRLPPGGEALSTRRVLGELRRFIGTFLETRKLEAAGILVRSETRDGTLEELPDAYKNVDEVIEVVHRAGARAKGSAAAPDGGN